MAVQVEKEGNCSECRFDLFKVPQQLEELHDEIARKCDLYTKNHVEVSVLVAEIVTLQKVQAKALGLAESRLKMVEDEMMRHKGANEERRAQQHRTAGGEDGDPKFWQEKWFTYVVITACVLVVLLAGAAIGQNVLTQYLDVMKGAQ